MTIILDAQTAASAVRRYNSGSYRGRSNIGIDRAAYERFNGNVPTDPAALVDAIRFVGDEYGGAQRRFLPHGYAEEAALIVSHLLPILPEWRAAVAAATPLEEGSVSELTAALLLAPFHGTKRWPVWATKTLHFIRPDAFPIMDSRAKISMGMKNLGSTARDYAHFSDVLRQVLLCNAEALEAAREADAGASPSDVKLLDKILYELGGS